MPRNANGPTRAKANLPTKICAACARPFAWRKAWARDWDAVKYCSDRCRAAGAASQGDGRHDAKAALKP